MKITRLYLFVWLLFVLPCPLALSQSFTQTLRGTIMDEDGKFPLTGANVVIAGTHPLIGTTTDHKGEFRFDHVPLGRADLLVTYLGYEDKAIPNVLISAGKEVILAIEMKESLTQISEVMVKARKNKGDVMNEMALISSRSFSVEETKRYAGSFQDPSRMVSAYAGVTSNPNGSNDIVVRGNSPKGILWRLDGIEIPNPNHFAKEGETGGPINALNSELLSNSDFYTGAFSPEYGDALSGVFDIKMRAGNNQKREYALGVGVLGTDITLEGPFKKNYGGSYLFNYRYSSLALLDQLHLVDFDGVPKYQDAAFKIQLPTQKYGTFSLFGVGGDSHIYEKAPESEESKRIAYRTDYGAILGTIGLNHVLPLNEYSFLKLSLSASNNGSDYYQEDADSAATFSFAGKGNWDKSVLRAALTWNAKLNAHNRLVAGINVAEFFYDMSEHYYDTELGRNVTGIDLQRNAGMTQGYVSWKYRLNNNVTIVSVLHGLYFSINRELSLEPRLAMHWQVAPGHAFNAGFGIHSKAESIITYYTQVNHPDGTTGTPNKNLGLSKAAHMVAGYEVQISENLKTKIDLYYQSLYHVPVENSDTSVFTMLNSDEGYVNVALTNAGKGSNYGLEYTLEHYFTGKYFFLLTASLYQSTYKAKDGITRNTKYNGNYAVNFLAGKEFRVGSGTKANTLSVNAKFFYSGGRRYLPVNLAASREQQETVYDYTHAWERKLDDIRQINLSVSYRMNRPRTSHELVIDIVNVTNSQARTWEYYNKYTGNIEYYHQLNLLPNVMYRVHF
jgi:hypothetical protein